MPLSIVVSNLVRFGVQLLLLLVMMAYFGFKDANFHVTYAMFFPNFSFIDGFFRIGNWIDNYCCDN